MRRGFQEIMEGVQQQGTKRVVISGKNDPEALAAILVARDQGWIDPVACGGPFSELRDKMDVHFVNSDMLQARQEALRLIGEGEAEALLDTGPLDRGFFSLLIESDAQIEGHLLSFVSVFMAPKNDRLTLLTDTLINSAPGLNEKIHIVENAIRVAKALRIDQPNIAALGPLELVNPSIPSTCMPRSFPKCRNGNSSEMRF